MQVKDANKNRRSTVAIGVVCLVLQLAIAPHVLLGSGCANFALVFAGIIALSIGGKAGVMVGFASGLVYDLTATTPIGLMAMLLTVFSYVLGLEARNRFGDGFVSCLSAFGFGALVVLFTYHLTMLMIGDTESLYECIMLRTLPSFALTFVAFVPFAYLQVKATGKVRGRTKGTPGVHRGSSHYDVSNL